MAHEALRGRRVVADYGGDYVPAVACEAANRGVVFEYGNGWADRAVFLDGDIQIDIVCRDDVYGAARVMAISKFIRGCRVF